MKTALAAIVAILSVAKVASAADEVRSETVKRCDDSQSGIEVVLTKQTGFFDVPGGILTQRTFAELTVKGKKATALSKPTLANNGGLKRNSFQLGKVRYEVYGETTSVSSDGPLFKLSVLAWDSMGRVSEVRAICEVAAN